ncbi:triple tyrosine motif-containing protein, partial [Balneolaceae bacterium ANBcel3]|nr:triple tyrosine motif-containing protein [Balneolaceae bacterium ANBcel3]
RQRLWVGTRGGGLHLYDYEMDTFEHWTTHDGLPSQDIYNIQEDSFGRIWMSTDYGISRFDYENQIFTNFGVQHGLQSEEFLSQSGFQDSEGYIYFGGINGFNRFHPEKMYVDETVPPVVFSDFKLYNESVPIKKGSVLEKHVNRTDEIVLPYDRYILTFNYVALNYNPRHPGNYAYMLEGFDTDWHNVGESRSATYTNLPSGEYLFRVKAANIAGIWGDDVTLRLVIVPPFWQTPWFITLSVLFITGLVFSLYRYRVRTIRALNKKLEEKVALRTRELYESNRELRDALDEVKSMRNEMVDKAHKAGMADLATGVLHNLGNILTSVTTSANMIESTVQSSKHKSLKRANQLLRENMENIETFIKDDPRGKVLLEYYLELEKPLDMEAEKLLEHVKRMIEKVKLITDVVAAQQRFARAGEVTELLSLEKIVEDSLKIQEDTIEKRSVKVVKEFGNVEKVMAGRSKLIHVLINLVKNAYEAMAHMPSDKKIITMRTWQDTDKVYLSIGDSGEGLSKEELVKVFSHGFTTKEDGHGFGLHSSSNYMKEMGGEMKVESDGKGEGATFILIFPRNRKMNPPGKRPETILFKD